MNCPYCDRQDIPAGSHYCPNCGKSLEIAARVEIKQDVKQNLGRVIGVQTQAIQGDVYGGDIYQVQVYVLSQAGRTAAAGPFPQPDAPPYKFLASYGARDSLLFKGRQDETRQVVRQIGEQRLVVLYGQAGVGKTSLLAAGVIPELIQSGALAVHIRDYAQPLDTALRTALSSNLDQLSLDLPADGDMPALVESVQSATQGTLVLVLDQFERLFKPGFEPERRAQLVNELVEGLRRVPPEYLRLILAVRDDSLVRLGDLQDALPDLFRSFIQLQPLDFQQARAAILEPLGKPGDERVYPVYYEDNLVEQLLIPDLDDLSPQMPERIFPPHLQIVCHWLYQAASGRYPPLIGRKLYVDEARGADGILARYLDETLQTQLADERELAKQVLVALASPGMGEWVGAGRLRSIQASPERLESVLKRLADAELLVQRPSDGRFEYAFSSQTVAEEVRRLAGPDIERSYQAEDELERVWSAWLAHDDLATAAQLRRLAQAGAHLAPRPEKALLMLRSAVARDLPAAPWLAWLNSQDGKVLVQELEGVQLAAQDWHSSRSQIGKARMILQLPPAQEEQADRPYGPIAQTAVSAPDPVTRQTAAIALLSLDRFNAIDRLDWALQEIEGGWRRLQRKAELRGALAEADPEVEALNAALPWSERAAVWGWRVWRSLFLDRQRLLALILGGGVGAGLGLGLLRALTALLTDQTVGVHAVLNFFYGFLLTALLLVGKVLAEHLLLAPSSSEPSAPHQRVLGGWLPLGLSVFLGGLLFALGYLFVVITSGAISLSGKGLVITTGILAGFGLSLALAAFPMERLYSKDSRWGIRAGAAGLVFALLHSVFLAYSNIDRSIALVWPGRTYRTAFNPYKETWPWQQLMSALPSWFNLVALLDAALVGVLLTVGILVGLRQAGRFLAYWQRLVSRAGD